MLLINYLFKPIKYIQNGLGNENENDLFPENEFNEVQEEARVNMLQTQLVRPWSAVDERLERLVKQISLNRLPLDAKPNSARLSIPKSDRDQLKMKHTGAVPSILTSSSSKFISFVEPQKQHQQKDHPQNEHHLVSFSSKSSKMHPSDRCSSPSYQSPKTNKHVENLNDNKNVNNHVSNINNNNDHYHQQDHNQQPQQQQQQQQHHQEEYIQSKADHTNNVLDIKNDSKIYSKINDKVTHTSRSRSSIENAILVSAQYDCDKDNITEQQKGEISTLNEENKAQRKTSNERNTLSQSKQQHHQEKSYSSPSPSASSSASTNVHTTSLNIQNSAPKVYRYVYINIYM